MDFMYLPQQPPTTNSRILEVILKRHVEIKGVAAVSEANAYERASTWQTQQQHRGNKHSGLSRAASTISRRKRKTPECTECLRHAPGSCSLEWLLPIAKLLLTAVVLNAKHKVATWVTDGFHGDAREFGHWGLGKQLPCSLEWHKHDHLVERLKLWKVPLKLSHAIIFQATNK